MAVPRNRHSNARKNSKRARHARNPSAFSHANAVIVRACRILFANLAVLMATAQY